MDASRPLEMLASDVEIFSTSCWVRRSNFSLWEIDEESRNLRSVSSRAWKLGSHSLRFPSVLKSGSGHRRPFSRGGTTSRSSSPLCPQENPETLELCDLFLAKGSNDLAHVRFRHVLLILQEPVEATQTDWSACGMLERWKRWPVSGHGCALTK